MTRDEAIKCLIEQPYKLGHLIGFTDLRPMHNEWIRDMLLSRDDKTLQAHRGSYKTTCVSIALAILIVLQPDKKIMFMRKNDGNVREVINQVQKILADEHMQLFAECIYGVRINQTSHSGTVVNTNLSTSIKGTVQLQGIGTSSSLTGRHYDYIFTDDIVTVSDRVSKAERDRVKMVYQELQNIKNRGGRIYNTGTPWHKEDCFTLMPNPTMYDCYSTGLISEETLKDIKSHMSNSLFCANYELRHVASEDILFTNPMIDGDISMIEQGLGHIDASYGGEDYTAFTIMKKRGDKYYVFGKCWTKHVDDVIDEIIEYRKAFMCGKIYCEVNADKGYLAKDLKKRGERAVTYHESMNKFIKITTYLKAIWQDVIFVAGTDKEYINQICDYTEDAEHDDCPDSCSSLARILYKKVDNSGYTPLWN